MVLGRYCGNRNGLRWACIREFLASDEKLLIFRKILETKVEKVRDAGAAFRFGTQCGGAEEIRSRGMRDRGKFGFKDFAGGVQIARAEMGLHEAVVKFARFGATFYSGD